MAIRFSRLRVQLAVQEVEKKKKKRRKEEGVVRGEATQGGALMDEWDKMNMCTKVRALRSCSGDVHVTRVVVSLVVHSVVGLTLGLIAHIIVVVFVVEFP